MIAPRGLAIICVETKCRDLLSRGAGSTIVRIWLEAVGSLATKDRQIHNLRKNGLEERG